MKITANEEYGLRILLRIAKLSREDIAEHENCSPNLRLVTLNEIAKHEGITTDYAMIFITALKNANLIESVRGKNGGYKLTREPKDISLLEVSQSLADDIFANNYCDKHAGGHMEHCIHTGDCTIRSVWSTMTNLVNNVLSQITVQDLIDNSENELNQILKSKLQYAN